MRRLTAALAGLALLLAPGLAGATPPYPTPTFTWAAIQTYLAFGGWATGSRPTSPAEGWCGYNTSLLAVECYNGTAWTPPGGGGALLIVNNLSDLANVATARTNLGLGTAAVKAASGSGGTVASVTGAFTIGHLAEVADTSGSIEDGGLAISALYSPGSCAAWQVLANASGSSAVPSCTSLTAVMDGLAGTSAQGSIVFRNGTQLTYLAPGTANCPIVSGGSGANPSVKCITHSLVWAWDSNTTVTNGTFTFKLDWDYAANSVLTNVYAVVRTAGTYTIQVTDNGSNVSGCTVNATTSKASAGCGSFAPAQHDLVEGVVSSATGAATGGSVQLDFTSPVQ